MSYVDNDNKENKEKKNNDKSKLGEFIQTVFASETIEETPEEIIEKDFVPLAPSFYKGGVWGISCI